MSPQRTSTQPLPSMIPINEILVVLHGYAHAYVLSPWLTPPCSTHTHSLYSTLRSSSPQYNRGTDRTRAYHTLHVILPEEGFMCTVPAQNKSSCYFGRGLDLGNVWPKEVIEKIKKSGKVSHAENHGRMVARCSIAMTGPSSGDSQEEEKKYIP